MYSCWGGGGGENFEKLTDHFQVDITTNSN